MNVHRKYLSRRSFVLTAVLTPIFGVVGWLSASGLGLSMLGHVLLAVGAAAFGLGRLLQPVVAGHWRGTAERLGDLSERQHEPQRRAWIVWLLAAILFVDLVLLVSLPGSRALCVPVGLLLVAALLGYLAWQTRGGRRLKWALGPAAGWAFAIFGGTLPLMPDSGAVVAQVDTRLAGIDTKLHSIEDNQGKLLAGQGRTHENQAGMQDTLTELSTKIAEKDPVRAAAASQGLDVDEVDVDDFAVSFQMSYDRLVLDIETTPVIEALATEGMLQARIGDRPWGMVYNAPDGGLGAMLSPRDIEADGPVELRLFANDGHSDSPTHGPYRFDIRASDSRGQILGEEIAQAKDRVEREVWLIAERYGGWRFDIRTMSDVRPVIKSIAIARQEGRPETEWVLPRAPDPVEYGVKALTHDPIDQLAMSSQEHTILQPFMRDPVLYTRVTFLDGSQSSWRRFDRISAVFASLKAEAAGELQRAHDGTSRLSFGDLLQVDLGGEAPPYSIRVGRPGEGEHIPLDFVPEHEHTDRLDHWFVQPRKVWGPVFPPDRPEVESVITGSDGREIARQTFQITPTARWHRVPSADPDAPPLYADTGEGEHHSLEFLPFPPRGTVSLLGGVGGIPTRGLNARPAFHWPDDRDPVLTDDFRVLYQLEDGSEQGPFAYDLRELGRIAREAAKPDAVRNRRRLLVALRRDDELGNRGYFNIQEHLGRTGQPRESYGDWVSGERRGIILAPKRPTDGVHGWVAVKHVRAGGSPESLTAESAVEIDMERAVRGRNNIGGLRGDSKMEILWLPLETERVFVQFELFDGTLLDPVEIPIVAASDL